MSESLVFLLVLDRNYSNNAEHVLFISIGHVAEGCKKIRSTYFDKMFTESSQMFSTHRLTVLTIRAILHLEQRKQQIEIK